MYLTLLRGKIVLPVKSLSQAASPLLVSSVQPVMMPRQGGAARRRDRKWPTCTGVCTARWDRDLGRILSEVLHSLSWLD